MTIHSSVSHLWIAAVFLNQTLYNLYLFSSQSLSQEIASQDFVGICAVDDEDEKDDPSLKLVSVELNLFCAWLFPTHQKQTYLI